MRYFSSVLQATHRPRQVVSKEIFTAFLKEYVGVLLNARNSPLACHCGHIEVITCRTELNCHRI
jgi:hypothetical protein